MRLHRAFFVRLARARSSVRMFRRFGAMTISLPGANSMVPLPMAVFPTCLEE